MARHDRRQQIASWCCRGCPGRALRCEPIALGDRGRRRHRWSPCRRRRRRLGASGCRWRNGDGLPRRCRVGIEAGVARGLRQLVRGPCQFHFPGGRTGRDRLAGERRMRGRDLAGRLGRRCGSACRFRCIQRRRRHGGRLRLGTWRRAAPRGIRHFAGCVGTRLVEHVHHHQRTARHHAGRQRAAPPCGRPLPVEHLGSCVLVAARCDRRGACIDGVEHGAATPLRASPILGTAHQPDGRAVRAVEI